MPGRAPGCRRASAPSMGPGSSPRARAAATSGSISATVSSQPPRSAPGPRPSWASTTAPSASSGRRVGEHRRRAVAAPVAGVGGPAGEPQPALGGERPRSTPRGRPRARATATGGRRGPAASRAPGRGRRRPARAGWAGWRRCAWPWTSTAWPSASARRSGSGWRSAASPSTKKVARAPARASASSTAGVQTGSGPSSKLSENVIGMATGQCFPKTTIGTRRVRTFAPSAAHPGTPAGRLRDRASAPAERTRSPRPPSRRGACGRSATAGSTPRPARAVAALSRRTIPSPSSTWATSTRPARRPSSRPSARCSAPSRAGCGRRPATTSGPATRRATTRSGATCSASGSRTTTRARPAAGTCSRPTRETPENPEQLSWLHDQLAGAGDCRLVFWHRPRFNAGEHREEEQDVARLWDAIEGRAAILLSGHDHNLQRFKPVDGHDAVHQRSGRQEPLRGRRATPGSPSPTTRPTAPSGSSSPRAAPTCASSPPTASVLDRSTVTCEG